MPVDLALHRALDQAAKRAPWDWSSNPAAQRDGYYQPQVSEADCALIVQMRNDHADMIEELAEWRRLAEEERREAIRRGGNEDFAGVPRAR